MTSPEIKTLCISASEKYLLFLKTKPEGGESLITINSIQEISNGTCLLELSAKIFDLDRIKFRILSKDYETTQISVVEYDYDKNTIIVKPSEQLKVHFVAGNEHKIFVVSDLKFLVERVRDWYNTNGEHICLPTAHSLVIANHSYSSDKTLSEEQKDAINTILTKPFSYIWGAPGTGKTQFVLSNAILQYVNEGKRVGVFAPTNNAIEQVLRGVLEVTEKAKISNKKIIRLGNPSRKFAEKHPEVCEAKGLQKQIDEIESQIDIYQKVRANRKKYNLYDNVKSVFNLFSQLQDNAKGKALLEKKFSNLENQVNDKKFQVNLKIKDANIISDKIREFEVKTSTIGHSIKKLFSSNLSKEEIALKQQRDKFDDTCQEIDILKEKLKPIEAKLLESRRNYQDNTAANQIIYKIKQIASILEDTQEITKDLNGTNFNPIEEKLRATIEDSISNLGLEAYQAISDYEIDRLLTDYILKRDELQSQTTANRIENCNIVAATLDTYIGRYLNEDLPIDHIFLDEAGYANVIKAMTLFRRGNRPITFLGDHKQLPPVCIMNENEIKGDNKNVFVWSQSAIYTENIFQENLDDCYSIFGDPKIFPNFNTMIKKELTKSYRFGVNLAEILQKHVYNEISFTGSGNGDTEILYISVNTHPIMNDPNKNREHSVEAEKIEMIIPSIKNDKFRYEIDEESNYVIVSPYKKQVSLIGNLLPIERKNLKILTVHGSQGREWNTVILSVSDTTNKFFTDSNLLIGKYLINTAVSRAKSRLIIVCNYNFWTTQPNQLISDLLRIAKPLDV